MRFPCALHLAVATGFVLAAAAVPAGAEPFWRGLVPVQRVPADPNADYTITDQHGPWLIMACTFSGEGAEQQARELVLELRSRFHMPAYVYAMTFDFSEGTRGRGYGMDGAPRRMRYQRDESIREIAVLVGHFPGVEDAEAQRVLERIQHIRPDALSSENREKTNQTLAAWRMIQTALLPAGDARRARGPMAKAFISRNPLLPEEYFVSRGIDAEVEKWNEDVPHTLLDCPGKVTVQVATFTGTVVLDQHKIEEYETGKRRLPSKLEEAALKAHKLTLLLRDKGYDAYQFHDRQSSIVTVGSFEQVGVPRPDGKIEIEPRIHAIMKTFGGTPVGAATPGFDVKTVGAEAIPLDIQPQIVQVPQRSISAAYSQQ
ncbi:MAG: hypothetical protein WDZ59_02055 [Pirellulales bacterium]